MAVTWLKRPAGRGGPGCTIALAETGNCVSGEIPDAIGWHPRHGTHAFSVVVEVKVSRSDFLADAKKPHRKDGATGMGNYRYFLAPQGVIQLEEVPKGWGLIEVNPRGHFKVRAGHVQLRYQDEDVWRWACNEQAEISTLALCLNRVGDPQVLQERLREQSNTAARRATDLARVERKAKALEAEVRRLRRRAGEPPFVWDEHAGLGSVPQASQLAGPALSPEEEGLVAIPRELDSLI